MQWVKATDRHPPNWFTAKLRNIKQNNEVIKLQIMYITRTMVHFHTGIGQHTVPIEIKNIEWYEQKDPEDYFAENCDSMYTPATKESFYYLSKEKFLQYFKPKK